MARLARAALFATIFGEELLELFFRHRLALRLNRSGITIQRVCRSQVATLPFVTDRLQTALRIVIWVVAVPLGIGVIWFLLNDPSGRGILEGVGGIAALVGWVWVIDKTVRRIGRH
jgi:hypothetical protein